MIENRSANLQGRPIMKAGGIGTRSPAAMINPLSHSPGPMQYHTKGHPSPMHFKGTLGLGSGSHDVNVSAMRLGAMYHDKRHKSKALLSPSQQSS